MARQPCILGDYQVKFDAIKTKKLANTKLIISHVFLLPQLADVYFQTNGAAMNLKLKGSIANENKPKIEYEGIVLQVSIVVEGITRYTP